MKDALIQRIAGYHQLRTVIWTTLVVLTGGEAKLFTYFGKLKETILFIVGIFLLTFFLYLLKETNKCLDKAYKKLEDRK